MVSIFSFFRMHKHAKQFSVSIRSIVTFNGVPSSTGRRSSFPFSSGRKHRRFKEANTGRERYFAVASRIVHNFKNSSREEAAFLCSSADNRAMIGSKFPRRNMFSASVPISFSERYRIRNSVSIRRQRNPRMSPNALHNIILP